MTTAKGWLVRRALLALALMVGFYVLALGVAAGLLWIPYAGFSTETRIPAKLVFFCVAGAAAIVWAILPRPDRFEPPGPAVRADAEPALFAALEEVAAATSQEMPAEVYLVNEVNAFVTQRGGVMGRYTCTPAAGTVAGASIASVSSRAWSKSCPVKAPRVRRSCVHGGRALVQHRDHPCPSRAADSLEEGCT